MRLSNCICIIVQSLPQLNSLAQPQKNIQFYHFSEEHGLGKSRCETIIQGTHGGLSEFNKNSERFVSYTIKDGLPDNNIRGIILDEAGNLWLGTGSGICKFTPPSLNNKKPMFRNYDSEDGLPSNGFSWGKKGPDGTLYFVCMEGIVGFKPDELKDNHFVPAVMITGISVNNKSIKQNDSTGILKLPFDETKKFQLSYRQNDFSFSFTALNYIIGMAIFEDDLLLRKAYTS
jgi:hypothetical protein